jgi:uncharacterized protein YbjT (DUF2867 family)
VYLVSAAESEDRLQQHLTAMEAAVAASGVRYTVLRHGMYADFVPFFATVEDGTAVIAAPAGEMAAVTDVVPRLTGHPARTVGEHLRAPPEDWANLRV